VEGNRLVDDDGNTARLTGVNWFGFETSIQAPHGLWTRDYRSMLRQIADIGFNTVRIPWSNAIMRDDAQVSSISTYGADAYDGTDPINDGLEGKKPLEILDLIIDAAATFRLKVMLDNHSRKPDGYMEEDLWYTADVSESQWLEDWVTMAERYLGNTTVIAFDLNNEPHDDATWGTGNTATDWNTAAEKCANAILAVNPNVLIVVEGVEEVNGSGYWWGGNLQGAATHPIEIKIPEKLVYSAHEYGPEVFAQDWFSAAAFPGNMADIWDRQFGYIMNREEGHVFIGEFGIKDRDAFEGRAGVWFETFLAYLGDDYSWTFWCMNPNSGDTDGILQYDWVTPHAWKVDALSPYLAPFID
jgi:aryl-phospho-beta-D-glucosidase BglC (GH1 family)